MAVRQETYAFARQIPYFIERGAEQTLTCPIRHGEDGSLVTPDSGTITITQPDGTDLVTDAAVTVASSVAGYNLTPASTLTLGDGWTVYWTLTFSGVVYPTYRQSAYLVSYVPANVISAVDLYARIYELRYRVPAAQGPTSQGGDGTGWQPQIDEAYYELLQRLLDDGREPWLLREVTGWRQWLLTRSLQIIVAGLSSAPGSEWERHSKDLYHQHRLSEARMRFQYDDRDPGRRKGGSPIIRLSAVGKPSR